MCEAATVTYEAQLQCAERELAMRRRVYPRWVADNKMTAAKADSEIAAMAAVCETLRRLAEADRLL